MAPPGVMVALTSMNVNGFPECAINSAWCKEGFKIPASGDDMTCVDIDECTEGLSRCDEVCHNVNGSYYCSCSTGMELLSDTFTCVDVDECLMGLCPAACLNTRGSFVCACEEGFVDASFVDNITGTVKVPQNTIFEWPTSIMATARDMPFDEMSPEFIGHVREVAREKLGVRCVDVNECALGSDTCPEGFTCYNTFGSFECQCPPGYAFNAEDEETITAGSTASRPADAASSSGGNRRKRLSSPVSMDSSNTLYNNRSSSSAERSTAATAVVAPAINRGVSQMLGSAIAAMSTQSALLQGMSAAGASRSLSHGVHQRATPGQWGRRPRQLQLIGALQQPWGGSGGAGGFQAIGFGGRSGNTNRGWIDNDSNGNDSNTGTVLHTLEAFILGHDIQVDKSEAVWVERHLKLGKHDWRRLSQCVDEDECTDGLKGGDGVVVAPCDAGGSTPCCLNLSGGHQCLKQSGVFASKACPVVDGYRTSVWIQ
eukprot:Lankesteria_metandrocarpae@DN2912_c0_g1_i2.p1